MTVDVLNAELLQGEGVVEDADVALAERGGRTTAAGRERAGGERSEDCSTAYHGAPGKACLLEEAQAGVGRYLVGCFPDRSVGVDLVDIDLIVHRFSFSIAELRPPGVASHACHRAPDTLRRRLADH